MPVRYAAAATAIALVLFTGSLGAAHADPVDDTAGEPPNVGDAKTAALLYPNSGQYQHDLAVVAAQAINWIATHTPDTPRAAVVFDIECNLPDACGWRA